MNGKEWKPTHTATLLAMHATHHDHEIAERTGHSADTVQRRRSAMGLPAHYGSRYGRWQDLPPASLSTIKRACSWRQILRERVTERRTQGA